MSRSFVILMLGCCCKAAFDWQNIDYFAIFSLFRVLSVCQTSTVNFLSLFLGPSRGESSSVTSHFLLLYLQVEWSD